MSPRPSIGIIMGSQSDWPTLKAAADMLDALGVGYETRIVSAHRTPDRMADYAKGAGERGLKAIIAGAGGAAHLPGMVASMTTLPVLGVPVREPGPEGPGFAAFHRPDAGRRAGGDFCHRRGGGEERGPACRRHPGAERCQAGQAAQGLAREADQLRGPKVNIHEMTEIKKLAKPVPPGGVIGIIGGGQLGRMLAMAAARLGLKAAIYNDELHAPAFQVTPLQLAAPYDDRNMLTGFAEICDAITFEFENLPADAIAHLASLKPVRPGQRALEITQDRLSEKNFVRSLGLKTAPFADVSSMDDAATAFARIGGPAILKTRRLGYDGKGQAKVASAEETRAAFKRFKCRSLHPGRLCRFRLRGFGGRGARRRWQFRGLRSAREYSREPHPAPLHRAGPVEPDAKRGSEGHRQNHRRCAGLCRRADGRAVRGQGWLAARQ